MQYVFCTLAQKFNCFNQRYNLSLKSTNKQCTCLLCYRKIEEEEDEVADDAEDEEEDENGEEMKKEKDILLMLYTELMGQPGALSAISTKLGEFGIKKTEQQVTWTHSCCYNAE